MMLVEQGKLSLDAPVTTYLPDYRQPMVVASFDEKSGRITTRPATRTITIRHLLTHTSGIGYAFDDPILAALQNAGQKDDDFPLLHDPGDKWTYGSSTKLLGQVVEKISGQPLDVVFQTRIFAPLGMVDTSYRVPEEKHHRLVTRHQRKDGALAELPNPSVEAAPVRGDGGLSSDAQDYGAFLRMLLKRGDAGGTRILEERTVAAMTSNQIGDLTVREMAAPMPSVALVFPSGAGRDRFGFGFQIAEQGTSARSRGSYSWAGVFNTFFWVDPVRQIGVVLLMQVLPFFDDACKAVAAGFEDRLYRN
jgi:CubicO group peptidase (beta-lactamase class C family)